MKSAKTKVVFGVLDLVAAGYAVDVYIGLGRVMTFWLFHMLIFPFLFSVPVALYNLHPLINRSVGRWEFWACLALALAGICMPNIFFTWVYYVVWDRFGQGVQASWVRSLVFLGINGGTAAPLILGINGGTAAPLITPLLAPMRSPSEKQFPITFSARCRLGTRCH